MPDFVKIGSVIKKERARLWKSSPLLGLQSLWTKAAGREIAANTRVVSLREGIMTVSCESGGWACELRLTADELVRRINETRPPEEVKEIRFVHKAQNGYKSRK